MIKNNSGDDRVGALKSSPKNKCTKIITQKEINYIDTLYLSCNLQDFFNLEELKKRHPELIEVDSNVDIEVSEELKYVYVKRYILKSKILFDNDALYLGYSDGRDWYKLPNYRIGVMDFNKAKKDNQYNIVIQYEHHHIFDLGFDLSNLDLPFGNDLEKYKFRRIDITKTAKVSKNYTYGYGYISPFKSHPFKYNRVGETTIYIGRRSNGCVFRIYDKSEEMKQSGDYKKIALFEDIFENIEEDLYTFELELRRSYIRDSLGLDNLSQFYELLKAGFNLISKIKFIEDTPDNRKKVDQKNSNRIFYEYLTEYVEFKRPKKKKYNRSYSAMLNRVKKEILSYLKSYPDEDSELFYIRLIYDLTRDVSVGKDLMIDIDDSDRKKEYNKMMQRLKEFDYEFHSHLQSEAEYYLTYKHKNYPYFKKS